MSTWKDVHDLYNYTIQFIIQNKIPLPNITQISFDNESVICKWCEFHSGRFVKRIVANVNLNGDTIVKMDDYDLCSINDTVLIFNIYTIKK